MNAAVPPESRGTGVQAGDAAEVARPRLFADRNVRWLAGSSLVSMLGDQFTLLALPWLVLRLTSDPLALGTVMAAMGLPRALLMLVGGAVVDRHAPRRVLLVTRHVSALLLALLAALVAGGGVTLALVHAFAIAIGIATAFSHPASSALVPSTVPRALIQPANAVLMSMRQATMLVGPLLCAALIAGMAARTGIPSPDLHDAIGLAWAFGLDAVSFVVAALTLVPLKSLAPTTAGFVQVAVMSWIQRRVPPRMLGRAMSVLLFLVLGLAPMSSALAGDLLRLVPLAFLFAACGLAMIAVAAIGAIALPMRQID